MTSPAHHTRHALRSMRARVCALLGTSSASLSVAEQRFRRVFEDSPAQMALADLEMRVLDANAGSPGSSAGTPPTSWA